MSDKEKWLIVHGWSPQVSTVTLECKISNYPKSIQDVIFFGQKCLLENKIDLSWEHFEKIFELSFLLFYRNPSIPISFYRSYFSADNRYQPGHVSANPALRQDEITLFANYVSQRYAGFFETKIQNFPRNRAEKYLVLKMPLEVDIREFLTG